MGSRQRVGEDIQSPWDARLLDRDCITRVQRYSSDWDGELHERQRLCSILQSSPTQLRSYNSSRNCLREWTLIWNSFEIGFASGLSSTVKHPTSFSNNEIHNHSTLSNYILKLFDSQAGTDGLLELQEDNWVQCQPTCSLQALVFLIDLSTTNL